LKIELEDYMTANKSIVEQLLMATAEISILNEYKYCVHDTIPPFLQSFKNVAAQSKNDITELTQLFTSAVGRFVEWKERLISVRVDETLRHNENNRQLLEQIAELRSTIEVANNLNSCLEKKVEVIEDSHRHASDDWLNDKMTLEKAQEEMKEHHRNEINTLGITIAELKSTMTKLAEDHQYEYQKILLDCQNQKDCHEAELSRLRHESTIEIKVLSQQLAELNAIVLTKKGEINDLVSNLESMKQQQVVEQSKQRHELESLSKSHRSVLDERERIHEELRQKYGEILLSEHEKEYQYVVAQKQITELKRQIAAERSVMVTKVSDIKSQLAVLRSSTIQQVGNIKQEWKSLFGRAISTKLNSIKQTYDVICNKQRHELEQQRMSDLSSSKRLAVAEKECRDAKAMVFNTIRESEMKLERAIRHLSDDHALQLEELSNQSKLNCDTIKAQLERMSKECELQSSAIATFTNIITEKEREINELKSKVRVTCILSCVSIEHVSSIWLT
jgi:chromosome segregation ATPase